MNNDNIEEILKNIGEEEIPADVHKIAQETSNNFSSSLQRTKQSKQHILLEQIMKSRITKLAAAAVIFIAVIAGLPLLDSKQGVALADVLAKIEQVRAFMYRTKMTMTGAVMSGRPDMKIQTDATVTISNDYGMKMEMVMTDANSGKEEMTQKMYIIPDQKLMISLMPKHKKYMRMEFDDDLLASMKRQNNDPREMIKQIMGSEYTELGRSVIDGIDVEGFHTTDPAFYGGAVENVECTLWVDVEEWLPVRTEMDFKMNEQMQMQGVIYDFQWDIPVVASDFEPVIPDDYTAFATEGMKMPSITEEAALEGLKFFAEITGQYPKKLNLVNLMQEFSAIKNNKNQTDAGMKLKEEMDRGQIDERTKKLTETIVKVQSIGMFYMTLIQNKKEPAYYGETVGPEDTDAVLLRWKISDNEYRIIFGDLSVGNVTAEELARLEKPL